MLLQSIVGKLDAELDRLHAIRRIVEGISSISPLDGIKMDFKHMKQAQPLRAATLEPASLPAEAAVRSPLVEIKARGRQYTPPRALSSTIPSMPVAVSAAQAATERERRVSPGPGKKAAATAALSQRRVEAIPSVDALRRRWLADS